jgi:hypothetical protein
VAADDVHIFLVGGFNRDRLGHQVMLVIAGISVIIPFFLRRWCDIPAIIEETQAYQLHKLVCYLSTLLYL